MFVDVEGNLSLPSCFYYFFVRRRRRKEETRVEELEAVVHKGCVTVC